MKKSSSAKPIAIALFGPTASGKTELAIKIAQKYNGQIINMDSVQIYKKADIGSAKPDKRELSLAKHHLVNMLDLNEVLNSFDIYKLALKKGQELSDKGVLPIFAGGTGLYFKAIFDGMFEGPNANPEIRERLKQEKEELGLKALHDRLKEIDPVTAAKVSENDFLRIERALEVYEITKTPISVLREQQEYEAPFDFVKLALSYPREILYQRINHRVDLMIEQGLLEEVRELFKLYPQSRMLYSAIGYKEVVSYLQNEITEERMLFLLKRNSRRFAKRQLTLFKALEGVKWFSPPSEEELFKYLLNFPLSDQ